MGQGLAVRLATPIIDLLGRFCRISVMAWFANRDQMDVVNRDSGAGMPHRVVPAAKYTRDPTGVQIHDRPHPGLEPGPRLR